MRQGYYYLLMLFSPFLGLFAYLRNVKMNVSKGILVFFVVIYGATLRLTGTSDGTRFQLWVYEFYSNKSFSQFLYELYRIIIFDPLPDTKGDVYIHVLSYFCGSVIHWPESFFAFVALIFGYFYISGLLRVFNLIKIKWVNMPSLLKYSLIIFIAFLGIDMMQSIRTWTGAWVLFNGVLGYYKTGKTKYLILIGAAPLFHVAYFVMVIPSVIALMIRKFNSLIAPVLFVTSFFIAFLPQGLLDTVESTEIGANKLNSYQVYDEDGNVIKQGWVESGEGGSSGHFYAKYGKGPAPKLGTQCLLFWFIISGFFRKSKLTRLEHGMLVTALLSASLANLAQPIPQLNGRMYVVAGVFTTALSCILIGRLIFEGKFNTLGRIKKGGLVIANLIFVPKVVYVFANLITYASVFLLTFPVIAVFSDDLNLTIREFIGAILFGE